MRRKDREVTDFTEIISVLRKCGVANLALTDGEYPYIVPLNFGFFADMDKKKLTLYFHSAKEGKKIELMKRSPNAFFACDCDTELISNENGCSFTMKYASVCGRGKVRFIEETGEKAAAFGHIMRQYAPCREFMFTEREVGAVCIFALDCEEVTAKRNA